jgi:hypothetical protein
VNPAGQVGEVDYYNYTLDEAGSYPIISAQQAWELLSSGQRSGRVGPVFTTSGINQNPKFWARSYQPGERADLVGRPEAFFAADGSEQVHMSLNNLVLSGDLAAAWQQVQASNNPFHIWGTVTDHGAYLGLQVEGWEEVLEGSQYHFGTIQRQDGQGWLVSGDGGSLLLPSLPADVADGTAVVAEGLLVSDILQWTLIQVQFTAEPPSNLPSIEADVEQVDLIFYTAQLNTIPAEGLSDPSYRALQPAWRFSGTTSQGLHFEVYVQAAQDELIIGGK